MEYLALAIALVGILISYIIAIKYRLDYEEEYKRKLEEIKE